MTPDMESAPTGSTAARLPIVPVALAVFAAAACAGTPPVAPPSPAPAPPAPGARFNGAGELEPPVDYRTWVFLTSGFAMSYGPKAQAVTAGGVDVHDNVYVSPDAYRGFMATGVWPEATMFVLEVRTAEETGSIVTRGRFQTELVAVEAAVKDTRRWPNGWGYFDFHTDGNGPTRPAKVLATTASCYKCHASHGAVEQTFTQFYPTLFAVARAKGTVRADFPGLPPSAGELEARIAQGGWPAGKTLLDETGTRWPGATVLRESSLERAAYRLRAEHGDASLALFEEITRRFPASANAWDDLAEAYEKSGAGEKAQQAVEKGLAVLGGDRALSANARGAIERSLKGRRDRLKR